MKHLLGLKDLTAEQIAEILSVAREMKKILNQNVKKTPHLLNKSVYTLFYENSTRTRLSFESAAKFMSALVSSIAVASSSVAKGETLIDTGLTLDALKADIVIIRHSAAGAPHLLAKHVRASVVNGGDGMNEHPTQALLDMLTIQERLGRLDGLRVAICGDILHSRVARSNIWGLTKMGAEVKVFAPRTLLPAAIELTGAVVADSREQAVRNADVVMALRLQSERQKCGMLPCLDEYAREYGIGSALIARHAPNAIILHPGPVNRGVEITSELMQSDNCLINEQVTNGVAVRMAVLYLLSKEASA